MSAPLTAQTVVDVTGVPTQSLKSTGSAASTPRLNALTCLECGADFDRVGQHGAFCATRCRTSWNNRRLARGAELYDLFMALRYDRRRVRGLGLFTALCRAARLFREADVDERAGRRSWGEPGEVLARRPYLRGQVLSGRKRT